MGAKFKIGDRVKFVDEDGAADTSTRHGDKCTVMGVDPENSLLAGVTVKTDDGRWYYAFTRRFKKLEETTKQETKQEENKMKYAFNTGDRVKVIKPGCGFALSQVGAIVTIDGYGEYADGPGYSIVEHAVEYGGSTLGNQRSRFYFGGMNGEKSFALVERAGPKEATLDEKVKAKRAEIVEKIANAKDAYKKAQRELSQLDKAVKTISEL